MKKLIIAFLAVTLLIVSCSKKYSTPNTSTTTFISKQTFTGIGTYAWEYETQNRLKNIVFASSNEAANKLYTYIVNGYDASSRIVDGLYDYVSGTVADIRSIYTYNAARKITRVDFIDSTNGNAHSRQTVTYPAAQRVMVNSLNSSGTVFCCDLYNLSADLKTITERKRYNGLNGTGSLLSTDTNTDYSTLKNYSTLYPVGDSAGPFSETVFATDVYTPASGAASTFTYNYESNADGYVTKRTSAGGSINR